jgi:hypothetical protein
MATGTSNSHYLETALQNWLRGGAFPAPPGSLYIALYTVAPTDAGGGTECSYSGYARQLLTLGSSTPGTTGEQCANTNTLLYPANAAAMSVVAAAIFDASSGGNMLKWATCSISLAAGQPLTFTPGQITSLDD